MKALRLALSRCCISDVVMMAVMEEQRESFPASETDERSGKYLLPHKYSLAVPEGVSLGNMGSH